MTILSLKQSSDSLPTYSHKEDSKLTYLPRFKELFKSDPTHLAHSSSCPNFKKQLTKQKLEKKQLKVAFPELFLKSSNYVPTHILGSGAYSVVCEAIDIRTNTPVAIKRIANVFNNSKEAMRTLREIKLMHFFNHHKNILNIREVILPKRVHKFNNLLVVIDKMEHDLADMIERSKMISRSERKQIIYKIISGLDQIHSANVIHRDLRPKNILLNNLDEDLAICDFGMGRSIGLNLSLLSFTTSTPYTPPEGLFSFGTYGKGVDIWAVGCILAEMILGRRLVFGDTHNDILKFVLKLVGTPSVEEIDQLIVHPITNNLAKLLRSEILQSDINAAELRTSGDCNISETLNAFTSFFYRHDEIDNDVNYAFDDEEIDLLQKIFTFNPDNRISASELLHHPYFNDVNLIDLNTSIELSNSTNKVGGENKSLGTFEYDDSNLNSLSSSQLQRVVYDRLAELFPDSIYPF